MSNCKNIAINLNGTRYLKDLAPFQCRNKYRFCIFCLEIKTKEILRAIRTRILIKTCFNRLPNRTMLLIGLLQMEPILQKFISNYRKNIL